MVEGAHPSRRIRKEREVSAKQDVENKENTVAKEVIGCAPFARRTVLQTTGAGPKPLRIQPQYKSRSTIKAEKKRKTKFIDDESDLEEQTRSILGTDRRLLQTCFVCGRRNPEENDENEVFWVSCSNTAVCKAWSHILCCTGVGSQCSICKAGHWRLEEV